MTTPAKSRLLLLIGIVVFVTLFVGIFATARQLAELEQVTRTRSRAAVEACTVSFVVAEPTPTPTPELCIRDVDIMLVLDATSAMQSTEPDGRSKLEWEIEAAGQLVDTIEAGTQGSMNIGVVSFGAQGNDGSGTRPERYDVQLISEPTNDYNALRTAIAGVEFLGSGTCVQCGIRLGNEALNDTLRERVVIIISDGKSDKVWGGNAGNVDPDEEAIREADAGRDAGIVYYVIGYGSGGNVDQDTLRGIAGDEGHYFYRPDAFDWAATFTDIFIDICESLTPTPGPSDTPTNTPVDTPTGTPVETPTDTPLLTPTDTPMYTPTNSPVVGQCQAIALYRDGSVISAGDVRYGDVLEVAVAGVNATAARLRVNGGEWMESTTMAEGGQFIFSYLLDTSGELVFESEVLIGGQWQ